MTWRWMAQFGVLSVPPASAARRPAGSSCKRALPREFTRRLVERAKALRVGDGLDGQVEMGPQINQQQVETSARYTAIAQKEGAQLLTGGNRLDTLSRGFFFAPTVFGGVGPEMRIAREEVFGPVVSVLECEDFDQAIVFANGIEYGLSTALYSRNVNLAFKAMRDLEAGITYVNAPTIGAEVHLPFRGSEAHRQRSPRRRHGSA